MAKTLRERLGLRSVEEQQADAAAEAEFERVVRQEFERVERETALDEHLPADHKTRDSDDTLERGVERLSDAYLVAIRTCYEETGLTPAEIDNINYADRVEMGVDEIVDGDPTDYVAIAATDRQRWLDEMHDDLVGNFIYGEYLHQLFSDKPFVESYAYYGVYASIMAALRFIAEYPNAIETLELRTTDKTVSGPTGQMQTYRYCEMRDQAVQFLDWMQVDEVEAPNIFEFITQAGYWVPGIGAIADKLLKDYSDAVRIERQRLSSINERVMDTPLPDEDDTVDAEGLLKIRRIYSDMRMERAILAYQSDPTGRSARDLARDYSIGYPRLLEELRERGLSRTRGGDRKAKKSA